MEDMYLVRGVSREKSASEGGPVDGKGPPEGEVRRAYQPTIVMGWAMEKRTRRAMFRRRKTLEMTAMTSCKALTTMSLENTVSLVGRGVCRGGGRSQGDTETQRERGAVRGSPFGIVNKSGILNSRAVGDVLTPRPSEGAYAEGRGDGAEGARDHGKRR